MGMRQSLRRSREHQRIVDEEIAKRLVGQKELIKEDLMREWREKKKKEEKKNDSVSKNQE